MKRAKFYIARVSLVFFCLVSSVASADPPSQEEINTILGRLNNIVANTGGTESALLDIENILNGPYGVLMYLNLISGYGSDTVTQLGQIKGDTSSIATDVADIEYLLRHLNIPDYSTRLQSLQTSVDSFSLRNHTDLDNITWQNRDLLNLLSNRLSTISSQLSSVGRDVLAGNPWWATNSAFSHLYATASQVHPTVSGNNLMSFPELMSFWSAQLMPFSGSGRVNSSNPSSGDYWSKMWGLNRQNSGNTWQGRSFSWFDFMAEVAKSNWVSSATRHADLQSTLLGISNLLSSAEPSFDSLAGNPWWYTNSSFSATWPAWNYNTPYPPTSFADPYVGMDFPAAFSMFLSSRFSGALNLSGVDLFDRWGKYGQNWENSRLWTFEDWLAEYLKSNLVLTTSASVTNLDKELLAAGYDTDTSDTITNTPLPQYSLPASESMSDAEDVLNRGETIVTDFVNSLPQPGTGGNPEIVLIPEFTVGGIHVPEYRASLNSPIVPTCHAVLSFLYSVGLACFVFKMAKAEYVYYASIGRQWGRYD